VITADSEYSGSTASARIAAEPAVIQSQGISTQAINPESELLRVDAELIRARAAVDRLRQLQQINKPSQDGRVVDWGVPAV
jgi:hypothetical protein